MRILLLALALISTPTLAAKPRSYQIDLKLFLTGHIDIAPRVIVNEGKEAEIGDNGRFIKVKADRVVSKTDNQVHLRIAIETMENGKRKVIATPEIIAMENETATMDISEDGKDSLRLSALVKRAN